MIFVGKGETVGGTNIDAAKQVENQTAGGADHLELGIRKET